MRTGDLSIYTACVEIRSLTSVIGSIRGRIWAFLMKSNSQPTQKTQVLQLENAEHPQDLNSRCKWDTSLPFLGQQLYFCQAATHLQRDCSLSDHTVGIIKKLGYQESLWVQLIRQQRSVPAQFCPKYTWRKEKLPIHSGGKTRSEPEINNDYLLNAVVYCINT